MKKYIGMILIASLGVSLLSGCNKGTKQLSEKEQNTIVIWHDKEDAVVNVIKEELAVLGPEIEVILEKKSDLTESLKMVGNNPTAAPDLYIFAHDKIGVYAEMEILSPITDLIPKEELSTYLPNTIKAATYKDQIYQLPIYYETLLFLYNKRYMKEENIPETTEELYEYMKNKTAGGHYGFVEQHSTPYYAAGWINGFGGSILSLDGKPGLDSKESIAALTYHKKFITYMPTETEYATVNTLFKEGMAHATIAGPWLIPTVRENGMEVGIAKMPIINETNTPIAPYMGVQGVQVLKHAAKQKKDAVTKVLQVMMKPEIQIKLALASGCAPAKEDCYNDEAIQSDEIVMAMKETSQNAVPMPNIPEMDVMWMVVGNLLTDINMSDKDVETSAKKAQQEAQKLIDSMQ